MIKDYISSLLTGLFLVLFFSTSAQPTVTFVPVSLSGGSLSQPVDIEHNGVDANKLYIVEKRGTIRIIENNTLVSPFFLDIQSSVTNNGERGLLGLAFHPNFPITPYYYVHYINTSSDSRIVRFEVSASNPDSTILNSETVLFAIDQPQINHNGGDLAFGPDGYLYIALGDGGGGGDPDNNGQDLTTLLGKMLRIDVNSGSPYGIPPGNPFVGNPDALDEIWAWGLRNPWRFSFDRATGDMWIADVGQGEYEEINFQRSASTGGENYGWNCYEGNHPFPNSNDCPDLAPFVFPVFEYPHNCDNGCPFGTGFSVTGGFVYRGPTYLDLQGYYICVDYGSDNFWLLRNNGSGFDTTLQSGSGMINNIATFGEDLAGELYASGTDGDFYQVTADGLLPITIIDFRARKQNDGAFLEWKFADLEDAEKLILERSTTKMEFETVVEFNSPELEGNYLDNESKAGTQYYRLVLQRVDGSKWHSMLRSVRFPGDMSIRVSIADDGSHQLNYSVGEAAELDFSIMDASGHEIQNFTISAEGTGQQALEVSHLPAGIYFLSTMHEGLLFTEKIIVR